MFKKLIVMAGIIGAMLTTSAQVGIKISGYPRAASLGDNDLFIIAYWNGSNYTTNKAVAFTNLTAQLIGIVNNNIKFGTLTGMLKVTGGTPGTATPGIDYQNPFSTGPGVTNISQVVSVMITNNDATITTTTNSGGVIGIGTVGLATQANLTTVSNTVNGKQAAFTTGLGITNVANVLSNNIVAGANVTITAGSSGQLSIASSGGGGGGTTGTVINSGASTANAIPTYSNTTGTNVTPSLVTITGNTNLNAAALTIGTGGTPFTITYANGGNITNGGNSVTVTNDIAQKFNAAVTIGSSSGIPKLTSGLVGLATAGSGGDYSSPAANEFGGFTSKASPIAADVFMLEDSAAVGAKKKATIGTIPIAASQVNSGVLAIGRLATGTPDGTKFVRDDGTLAVPAGGGGGLGYVLKFGGTDTSFNPANGGFTYYSGGSVFAVPTTTFTNQCVPILKSGTVKGIAVRIRDDGTLGSSENIVFKISINGAAGTGTGLTMTSTIINNLASTTSESVAVTAGQTIALTFTTPTWATPPTTCYLESWIYIE